MFGRIKFTKEWVKLWQKGFMRWTVKVSLANEYIFTSTHTSLSISFLSYYTGGFDREFVR